MLEDILFECIRVEVDLLVIATFKVAATLAIGLKSCGTSALGV
jgi:hypothetical protein